MTTATKLDSTRLHKIFTECLFNDGEDSTNHVKAEGIMRTYGFHPERLESHREEIVRMLMELPDDFMKTKGGGMSFLNACMDRHGNHWAEHATMELLFTLGIAIGKAKCLLPRDMWSALPGGMPYYCIDDAA